MKKPELKRKPPLNLARVGLTKGLASVRLLPLLSLLTRTLLVVVSLVAAHLVPLIEVGATSSQQISVREYYVTLPKLGHLRGFRSAAEPKVISFMNIPYAAPPIAMLRFMPPGAHQTSGGGTRFEQTNTWTLMPTAHKATVRLHSQFGPRCVRLSDWLPEPVAANSRENKTTPGLGFGVTANFGSERTKANLRAEQSEDCLNLNVFVPIIQESTGRQMRQPFEANYPSQRQHSQTHQTNPTNSSSSSSNYETTNEEAEGAKDQIDQVGRTHQNQNQNQQQQPLWPISQQGKQQTRLPVLVLFHGPEQSNKANTFEYLSVARRTNCVVITFNHRIGLLGFLPYVDEAHRSFPRHNHALWDQIGLLHWLKHNVANFNGDPQNLALLATDNQASKLVRLLTMSPLTKGLFNRTILVHDENSISNESTSLSSLLKLALEARDLRKRLTEILIQTVKIYSNNSLNHEDNHQQVYQFLQSANLTQLAILDEQLERQSSEQLLAMVHGPSLDDKMFFPQLSSLFRTSNIHNISSGNLTGSATEQTYLHRAQLNYCLYLRQIHANGIDSLGLLASISNPNASQRTLVGTDNQFRIINWHRDYNNTILAKNQSPLRRSVIATNFNHLYNLHMLNQFLNYGQIEDRRDKLESGVEGRENDEEVGEEDETNLNRRQQKMSNSIRGSSLKRRRRNAQLVNSVTRFQVGSSSSKHREDKLNIAYLELQLSSLAHTSHDMMLGYFETQATSKAQRSTDLLELSQSNFTNIANALANATNLSDTFVAWLKLADTHFVSTLVNSGEKLAQLCDLFVPKFVSSKSTYAFLAKTGEILPDESAQTKTLSSRSNWLLDSMDDKRVVDGLANFVKFGNPNYQQQEADNRSNSEHLWPPYDTLNRRFRTLAMQYPHQSGQPSQDNTTNVMLTVRDQIRVHLDLLPYLMSGNFSLRAQNNSQNEFSADISVCLSELDLAISKKPADGWPQTTMSNTSFGTFLSRLPEETRCLTSALMRFRGQLRQYAANDLEPIFRLNKQQQQQQQQHLLDPRSQASSSITTRNLINDNALFAADQNGTNFQIDGSESTQSGGSSLVAYVSPRDSSAQSTSGQTQHKANFQGFLAKAYKDAVGQALTVVVGTGGLIFALNLAIVAIIALRSARNRRLNNNSAVQDSSASQIPILNSKRPTLKRATSQQQFGLSPVNGCAMQLTSSIRADKNGNGNQQRAKQLKFDLSSVGGSDRDNDYHHGTENNSADDLKACATVATQDIDRKEVSIRDGAAEQQQLMFMESSSQIMSNGAQDNELIISLTPLLDSYNSMPSTDHQQHRLIQTGEIPIQVGFESCDDWRFGASDSSQTFEGGSNTAHYIANKQVPSNMHSNLSNLGSNGSPFASQSTPTTTSATNIAWCGHQPNLYQKKIARYGSEFESNQQLHGSNRPSVDAASPSSSTTISVTPIQLESLVAAGGLSPEFQLAPIGLIYRNDFSGQAPIGANFNSTNEQQMLLFSTGEQRGLSNNEQLHHRHKICQQSSQNISYCSLHQQDDQF